MGVESSFCRHLLRRSERDTGLNKLRARCRHHSLSGRRLEWPVAAARGKRKCGTDQPKSETIADQTSPRRPYVIEYRRAAGITSRIANIAKLPEVLC
jgi:hypothetical protein